MRTTIIPAQITTVEDRIAGSLTMTQILILMFPILWTAIIYILLPTPMKLAPYKLILILVCVVVCIALVIRIKDKIVAEWIGVVIRYRTRPKYWLYNKNDAASRIVDLPDVPNSVFTKRTAKKPAQKPVDKVEVADLVKLQSVIDSGKVAVRYQFEKK